MVEKLEAYKAELEAKKAELNDAVIDVEAEVIAFREKRVAEETAKKAACIAKIDSDINCIEHLIECEKAKEVATVEAEAVVTGNIVE